MSGVNVNGALGVLIRKISEEDWRKLSMMSPWALV